MGTFYDIKSKFLAWAADIRIYPLGIVLWGETSYHIKGHHIRQLQKTLEPGDLLLRRFDHYIGTLFIRGHFSHAAVYVHDQNIIHMLGEGVDLEDLLTFTRCDDIMVLRPKDKAIAETAVLKAYKHLKLGVEYDYDFNFKDEETMSCTEFADNCFGYPFRAKYGRSHILLPDEMVDLKIFDKIWTKK